MTAAAAPLPVRPSRGSAMRAVVAAMTARPSGLIGLVIIAVHVVVALISPMIVPYDYAVQNAAQMFAKPSAVHWLGTDQLGRDVLTRTLLGGRQAILVTALATLFAVGWGALVGITVGYLGGRFDDFVMRVIDAFQAVPWLLLMMLIVTILGGGVFVLVAVLGFCYGLPAARVARSATLDVVARDFVSAACARGERAFTIIARELLPNVRDIVLVDGAMQWSWMLLWFSSLSFLGLGVAPPTPDWGLMVSDARLYLTVIPLAALAPMIALSSLIVGINLTADALGKALGVDRAQKPPS